MTMLKAGYPEKGVHSMSMQESWFPAHELLKCNSPGKSMVAPAAKIAEDCLQQVCFCTLLVISMQVSTVRTYTKRWFWT